MRRLWRAFSAFHALALIEEIRVPTTGGYVLGGATFVAEIDNALGQRVMRGQAGRPPKPKLGMRMRNEDGGA